MKTVNNFLIIGGDKRQNYMADYIENSGKKVEIYAVPSPNRNNAKDLKREIECADAIILPLPMTKDNKKLFSVEPMKETLDEIVSNFDTKHFVFAGMLGKGMESKISNRGAKVFDYFKREDVTIMNTVPTVQGILKCVIDNIDYTIYSSKCAVFGYGRVAKITADTLSSLGAQVTVCARKQSDIVLAEINGLNGCFISDFHNEARDYDIIINTVPSLVIDRNIIEELKYSTLIIDVASAPFGTDFAAAYEIGIKAIQCPSLPGKVAPKTAGKIIVDGIMNILREEEYE